MKIKKLDEMNTATPNILRRCLNDEKGAYNKDRYYASILRDWINVDDIIYNESLVDEARNFDAVPKEKRGGIITFSRDMNSTQMSENKYISFFKQKLVTLVNRLSALKRIDKVAQDFKLEGWTITKGLHGKYVDRKTGVVFDEKSLSVELVGITTDTLLDTAENLCTEFQQQSVLVKSYENGDIWFVYQQI